MENQATVDVGKGDFFRIINDSLPQEYATVQLVASGVRLPVSFIMARIKGHDARLFAARRAEDVSTIAHTLMEHVEEVMKVKTHYPHAFSAIVTFHGMSEQYSTDWAKEHAYYFNWAKPKQIPVPARV
jgi:hypothetical protein